MTEPTTGVTSQPELALSCSVCACSGEVRGLVQEDVDARDSAAVISRELRALTRRACQMAEQDMAALRSHLKDLADCLYIGTWHSRWKVQ